MKFARWVYAVQRRRIRFHPNGEFTPCRNTIRHQSNAQEIDLNQELTDGFAARQISCKLRSCVSSGALPESDVDDVAQEVRLDLFKRFDKFDPSAGHWHVFASVVIENAVATALEARQTLRAKQERSAVSLTNDGRAAGRTRHGTWSVDPAGTSRRGDRTRHSTLRR